MFAFSTKRVLGLSLLALSILSTPAFAAIKPVATWTDYQLTANPSQNIRLLSNPVTLLDGKTISFTSGVVDELWSYTGGNPPPNQNANSVAGMITTQFSIDSVDYVSHCDSPTSLCNGATGSQSSKGYTFNSTSTFDYLAIHYGQGELLFHFSAPTSTFFISGIPLSNYRAYNGTPPVPEPDTYAMMLAGIALMGTMAKRRTAK